MEDVDMVFEYFPNCITTFHEKVFNLGYLGNDFLFSSEFKDVATRTIANIYTRLRMPEKSSKGYYAMGVVYSLWAGMIIASEWDQNHEVIRGEEFSLNVIKDNFGHKAIAIFGEYFNMNKQAITDFSSEIFDCWQDVHKPYDGQEEPSDATFWSSVAVLLTGAAIVLNKLGYVTEIHGKVVKKDR